MSHRDQHVGRCRRLGRSIALLDWAASYAAIVAPTSRSSAPGGPTNCPTTVPRKPRTRGRSRWRNSWSTW